MKWEVIKSEITGTSHIKDNAPCQDVASFFVTNNNCTIVLADGAGSAKYSEIGAKLACESIISIFKNDSESVFDMDISKLRIKLIHGIRTRLGMRAKKYSQSKHEFASTLLFISIMNEQYIAGHIGDGVIGALQKDESFELISKPENGEFANTTYFTTSDNYRCHFRLYKGNVSQYKALFLMSDGAAECLYHKKEKSFASAIQIFSSWIDSHEMEEVNKALYENMLNMFPIHTSDDCSFIMCQRKGSQ